MYINTISGLEQLSLEQVNRSSQDYIRWLQSSLNSILGLNLKVDGIMGLQTRNAIRSFQQKEGLMADGIVGPKTEATLMKATNTATPVPIIAVHQDTIKPADARLKQFDKDSAKLKDFHEIEIDRVADKVVASWKTGQPVYTVYVKGHTSSEGSAQYNIGLGNRRALTVRKALQKALERKQKNLSYRVLVLAQSNGAREPIDTNETEEGRSQNRRVEIFLSMKQLLPLLPKKPKETEVTFPEGELITPRRSSSEPRETPRDWEEFWKRQAACRDAYPQCKKRCAYKIARQYGPDVLECLPLIRSPKAFVLCLAGKGLKVGADAFDKCAAECDPIYADCMRKAKAAIGR